MFKDLKKDFEGKILHDRHPDSVRVRLIAKDIIGALQRAPNYDSVGGMTYANPTLTFKPEKKVTGDWRKEEILDDKWVKESRRQGEKQGVKPSTHHLEGLNWEVLVVDEPVVNAFCLPGVKIVVYTGLLKHFRTDTEIATIIGHEVGHVVARHSVEHISKNLWIAIIQSVLYEFFDPKAIRAMSKLLLKLPFSRKMEMEADYIGLLLMASAGFDPRMAPKVYEKLGKVGGGESVLRDYLSTHPSGKKRAELLAHAQVMGEALSIYRQMSTGRGVEGFL